MNALRRPILSHRQQMLIRSTANMLPVHQRDAFFQRVEARLTALPADGAVAAAVNAALDMVARDDA